MAYLANKTQAYSENPVWDCLLNSNAATTPDGSSTSAIIGVGAGANRRRFLKAFPVKGHWTAVDLREFISSGGVPTANFNLVVLPVVAQLDLMGDGSDISWNNVCQAGTFGAADTDWTEANAATTGADSDPGGNTDSATRGVFAMATSMTQTTAYILTDTVSGSGNRVVASSGSLLNVLNAADLAARRANSTFFVLMFSHENSNAGTGRMTIATVNDTDASHKPLLTGTVVPAPYDGEWMELGSDECAGPIHKTKATVSFIAGARPWLSNDRARVRYGTNADLSGSSTTTAIDLSSTDPDEGESVLQAITGLSGGNVRYYYRWEFSTDASNYAILGSTRSFITEPDAEDPIHLIFTADSHQADAFDDYMSDTDPDRYTVLLKTHENIESAIGTLSPRPCGRIEMGDSEGYTKFASTVNKFPRAADGTPDVSADWPYAKTEAQAQLVARVDRREFRMPYHSLPVIAKADGNHDGRHWFHAAANNDAINDLAAWGHTADQAYFGRPASLPGSRADDASYWSDDSAGRYYAKKIGSILLCVMNPYTFSQRNLSAGMLDGSVELPQTMATPFNWTFGSAQYDFFFHASTGVVPNQIDSVSWVVFVTHNMTLGGYTAPGAYGHGGDQIVKDSGFASDEWGAGAVWKLNDASFYNYQVTNPAIYTLGIHDTIKQWAGKAVVTLGHDHLWSKWKRDGVLYVTIPQQCGSEGEGQTGSWNQGYVGTLDGYTYHKPNCGYVVCYADQGVIRFTYKRTYVAGTAHDDPEDGIITNDATVDTASLSASSGGRSRGRGRGRGRMAWE